jgi:SAM-dependent methyltransferase
VTARTDPAFFDAMYRHSPDHDPWSFASDPYERGRYRRIVAALPEGRRFRAAFEPGCAIGVLSALLADRCDHVLAVDHALTAVRTARRRYPALRNVEFRCASLQHGLRPEDGPFDLLCLSEIGYYFDADDLARVAADLVVRLAAAATVVACHWTGSSADHHLGGREVHDVLGEVLGGRGLVPAWPRQVRPGFVIDRWDRPDRWGGR